MKNSIRRVFLFNSFSKASRSVASGQGITCCPGKRTVSCRTDRKRSVCGIENNREHASIAPTQRIFSKLVTQPDYGSGIILQNYQCEKMTFNSNSRKKIEKITLLINRNGNFAAKSDTQASTHICIYMRIKLQ